MSFIPIQVPYIKYHGMAVFPFLFLKNRNLVYDKIFIKHEKIHFTQQKELLFVPFYIIYLLEYLDNLIIYRNHDMAYRNISFEREAYANQFDMEYLAKRKRFAFKDYSLD